MALATHLSSEDVRKVQLQIFRDRNLDYIRNGVDGMSTQRDVQQRITNVKGQRIRKLIVAVEEFEAGSLEAAWSHHMALHAGVHIWPDGNHRTGMVSFALALARAFDSYFEMTVADAKRMVTASRTMRDKDCLDRGSYYTVAELADPDHSYRKLFGGFEKSLTFGPE